MGKFVGITCFLFCTACLGVLLLATRPRLEDQIAESVIIPLCNGDTTTLDATISTELAFDVFATIEDCNSLAIGKGLSILLYPNEYFGSSGDHFVYVLESSVYRFELIIEESKGEYLVTAIEKKSI